MKFLPKLVVIGVSVIRLMAMESKEDLPLVAQLPVAKHTFKFEQTMPITSIPDDIAFLNVEEARKAAAFYKSYLNSTWLMMEHIFADKFSEQLYSSLVNPDAEDKEIIGEIPSVSHSLILSQEQLQSFKKHEQYLCSQIAQQLDELENEASLYVAAYIEDEGREEDWKSAPLSSWSLAIELISRNIDIIKSTLKNDPHQLSKTMWKLMNEYTFPKIGCTLNEAGSEAMVTSRKITNILKNMFFLKNSLHHQDFILSVPSYEIPSYKRRYDYYPMTREVSDEIYCGIDKIVKLLEDEPYSYSRQQSFLREWHVAHLHGTEIIPYNQL